MATDAASIGANFSDYQGNAALGGAGMPAFQIDTRPLQQLAQYTFYYKRDEWRQRQQETDAKVKELADLSNIALNDLRGKDKEQMVKEFSDLVNYYNEYARKSPKTIEGKMQLEIEKQTKYGAFKNNYNSGKTRAITYQKRFNDIMGGTQDAKTKDAELEILNKEFQDTDIGTTISAMPKFKIDSFDIPTPTTQTFTSLGVGPNQNVSYTMGYYNPTTNAGLADAAILGFKKAYPKEGTVEYNNLTQNEKDEAKVQATVNSGAKGWIDATEPLNAALKNYIKDGVFDATSFENDNASNTTLMSAYNAVKRYGEYNKNKFEQASNRIFSDKGLGVALPENVKADDFKVGFVDFAKGVKTNQLVQAGMFAKFGGDKISEKKIQETDNAIQMATLNETIRDNKADQYLRGKEYKLNEDKWKTTQVGGTTQVNGAMERAKRIYADMLKLADKNGLITPDKIRQLNVEQLKYLGIEAPEQRDETGKIISAGGFKPLSFITTNKKGKDVSVPHAIQLVDGEVRVLVNAQPLNDKDNRYTGQYDPTKSTNLFNIGTNILNEELKNSGSKELNSYLGIDVLGGITSNTDGGTSTVSGQTQNKVVDINTLDPNGFKKEGKNYRYKDGTLFDASGKIVKEK